MEDFYRSICTPQAVCCPREVSVSRSVGGGRETPQLVGRDKTRGVLACSRSAHLRKVGRVQVVLSQEVKSFEHGCYKYLRIEGFFYVNRPSLIKFRFVLGTVTRL